MEISRIGAYGVNAPTQPLPFKVGMPGEKPPEHVPAGMEVRRRIFKEFDIQVLDSDVKFTKHDLLIVEEVLHDVKKRKKRHLIGVKEIVKNKEMKIRLLNAALIHAGGAYVPEEKRVYLFDELKPDEIREVLIHEIGHAVNYYNLPFENFMHFVSENGWQMTEMRPVFYSDNKFYQFGTKKIELAKDKWDSVWRRFSLNSLAKEQDVLGQIFLNLPKKSKYPWDKNPLEKFAWAYEWFYNKKEAFQKIAQESFEDGNPALKKIYDFMDSKVFEDNIS